MCRKPSLSHSMKQDGSSRSFNPKLWSSFEIDHRTTRTTCRCCLLGAVPNRFAEQRLKAWARCWHPWLDPVKDCCCHSPKTQIKSDQTSRSSMIYQRWFVDSLWKGAILYLLAVCRNSQIYQNYMWNNVLKKTCPGAYVIIWLGKIKIVIEKAGQNLGRIWAGSQAEFHNNIILYWWWQSVTVSLFSCHLRKSGRPKWIDQY